MPSSRVCYSLQEPPPPTASCYICLENSEESTNNKPLLRNCACRGDAGWAHIACLVEFAASKFTELRQKQDPSKFWENCILCKTPHMQFMGLAMAEAFVKQYEHLPDTNDLRFSSLYSLASSKCNVKDTDGAIVLYNQLLKICDVLTSTGVDVRKIKGNILCMMGNVYFGKEQFNDALPIFERRRELLVALLGPNSLEVKETTEMIVTLKESIGIRECGHTDPAAKLVMARQKFKENQECIDIVRRLKIHCQLVEALRNDGKIQESMEQFKKLLAESRQSLGPDHPETIRYESLATYYQRDPAAELVVARQKFKECRKETNEPAFRLSSYLNFIVALENAGRHQEAIEQCEALVTESRQTLGPDLSQTYETFANNCRRRIVKSETPMASNSLAAGATTSQKKDLWAVIDCKQAFSGQRVKVLGATKDGKKYVCLIKNDKGVCTKFKVAQTQFILEAGTTVVVHGLVSSTDLNGSIGIICLFDKEKGRYAVSVGKKKTTVSIKPINLNVVFT